MGSGNELQRQKKGPWDAGKGREKEREREREMLLDR